MMGQTVRMLLVLLPIISVNSICNYIETDNEFEFFQLDTCAYFDTTNDTSWGYYCFENETDGTYAAQQIHYSGTLKCQGLGITMGEIYDCNGADDACYCINGKSSDCQLATVQNASCSNNSTGYQQYTYVVDVCRVNDVSPASSSRLQCDSTDSSIIAYEYNGTYNCTGSYTEKEIAGDFNVTQTDTCYTISCNVTSSGGDTTSSTTNEPTNTPKPESDAEIVYEWTTVDYNWENSYQELEWIANGSYIIENNAITGVKVYKGTVYVTVPRWRTGVPSTLNKVVTDINGNPLLQPYPSLAMQDVNNCEMLQNIQSMEITPNGKMWILDVGRKYFFDNVNVSVDNSCPPKLWIWDMNKNELDRVYIFPNEIANYTNSFLNDLALDVINNFAYISDVFGYPFPGGVVTYDYDNNISNRFADPVMNYDGPGSPARNVIINGQEIYDLQSANDGIALSPDLKWLYFCPLASYRLYRVPAENARMYKNDSLKAIEFIGNRTSQMDGMTFDNNSILYYGSLSETAVRIMEYEYDIDESDRMNYSQKHSSILVEDNYTLQWADTFAWGEDGYVYFSTNRLHRFFLQNMDYDGGEGANFRINRVYVGAVSYMMGQISSSSSTPSPTGGDDNGSDGSSESGLDGVSGVVWLVIVIILFVLVVVFGGLWIKARKSVNNQDDTGYVQMAK